MSVKKNKPLNLLDNKGFWPEKAAVADGIKDLLSLGGAQAALSVRDYGHYRSPQWRDQNNNLVPWQSVDWYVYDALDEERMQVDCSRMLSNLAHEPWRDEKLLGDHYDLYVIEEDMFDPEDGGKPPLPYVVGRCKPLVGGVISTNRITVMSCPPYNLIKTEVMRQVCFMFGIPSRTRPDVAVSKGGQAFCPNTCILRAASIAPDDWLLLTMDRLRCGPLCPLCLEELRSFFAECATEQTERKKRRDSMA
jgi:hypothetical protein